MGRLYILIAVWIAGALLFAALTVCGGARTAAAKKIIRLAIDTEPKTLDPIGITDTISDGLARKVHSTLVRFEKQGQALVPVPELAEKFEISPDGKLYTFTLRRGVRFHNGREMKAADAVYSLERLLSPESKRPDWIKPFVAGSEEHYQDRTAPLGIKATGEYTLTIELNAPFAPFLQHLCTVNCAVVPREAVENAARPFARHPAGLGPFKLEQWHDNKVLVFARNTEYFKGVPKLSAIKFFIMKEPATRLENYFAGELDAAEIPYGRVKSALERAGEANTLAYSTFRTNYLGFGFPSGDFKNDASLQPWGTNKLLRQAMAYALDREYLCNTVLEGRGVPATGVLPPGMPGYQPRPGWPKDAAKAKSLLAQAGYPGGRGLPPLLILHRNDENTRKIAQVVASDLEGIGIQVTLQARDWNNFLELVANAPRPAFLLGWIADYPDPDNFLYVLFNSRQWGSDGNHCWYANAEVDRLTSEARSLTKMEDRARLYARAEDIILDECPWLCTYCVRNVVLLRKEVTGIRENVTPLDTGTEFPQVDFAFVDITLEHSK